MREAYTALAQEPWGFLPHQIARLTDWQIFELYVTPAADRARNVARPAPDARGAAPGASAPIGARPAPRPASGGGPDYEPGTEGHRRQCIAAYVDVQGLSPQRAAAQYDRQLAEWRATQARPTPPPTGREG